MFRSSRLRIDSELAGVQGRFALATQWYREGGLNQNLLLSQKTTRPASDASYVDVSASCGV
jgi:hypothetical protein